VTEMTETKAAAGPAAREGSLEGFGGVRLRTVAWEAESPKGRVVVVHGLGEHGGRYDLLAGGLVRRGYSVMAYDHRGHGRSEGKRSFVKSFDELVEDLSRAHAHAADTLGGAGPAFLYGHSAGALILLRYLQTRRPHAPGAVLSAPWLATRARIPQWKLWAAVPLRILAPAFRVPTEVKPWQLTSDEELQRRYEQDPMLVHGISVGLYDAVLGAQKAALSVTAPPAVPTLMLIPTEDPVVDGTRAEAWGRSVGGIDIRRLEGLRHEPHNERSREEVFRLVADWFDARTPVEGGG
jgi:alpha-beta hydrolase superfamily lysophospholipase